jgi:hypothetical protein
MTRQGATCIYMCVERAKRLHFEIGIVTLVSVKDIKIKAFFDTQTAIVDKVDKVYRCEGSGPSSNALRALTYG